MLRPWSEETRPEHPTHVVEETRAYVSSAELEVKRSKKPKKGSAW